MFCVKCGSELKPEAKFCVKCGAKVEKVIPAATPIEVPVPTPAPEPTPVPVPTPTPEPTPIQVQKAAPIPASIPEPTSVQAEEPKKKKKGLVTFLLVLLALAMAGGIAFLTYKFLSGDIALPGGYDGYLKKAESAYDNEDYDSAIEYYQSAIELEPENVSGYIGLSDVYMAQGDFKRAVKILEKGYKSTDDEDLLDQLEKVLRAAEEEGESITSEYVDLEVDVEDEMAPAETAIEPALTETATVDVQDVSLEIHQVDNSNFPEVTFYASITDEAGNVVENADISDFKVQEVTVEGLKDVQLDEVYRVMNQDAISVNLVLDASSSMDSNNKMVQAQNAAVAFISKMHLNAGDQVEIISFDDYDVYGHLDYIVRYLPENAEPYSAAKYLDQIDEILRRLIAAGKGLDINSKALYSGLHEPNPCTDILRRYHELGGEIITFGSDAHSPENIARCFEHLKDIVTSLGFTDYCTFENRIPAFHRL